MQVVEGAKGSVGVIAGRTGASALGMTTDTRDMVCSRSKNADQVD